MGRWSIIDKYQLGVIAEPLPGDEIYHGKLVIPYLTRDGVRGLKFRCLEAHNCKDEGHSKYTQPGGQIQRLYNTNAYFSGSTTIGVCEGEIDAIAASELLGIPTIGVPGATQWKANRKYWELVLKDFTEIIIFADGDQPGKQLAADIAADITGSTIRIVQCDDKQDVNSMCLAGEVERLLEMAGVE